MSFQPEAELVDTSDAEEQELQAADSTQYWDHPSTPPRNEPPRKKPRLLYDLISSTSASGKIHHDITTLNPRLFPSQPDEPQKEPSLVSQPHTPPHAAATSGSSLEPFAASPNIAVGQLFTPPSSSLLLSEDPTNQHITHTPNNPPLPNDTSVEGQEHDFPLQEVQFNKRQYSLRTRAPRQLNPYQFDAAVYKQQMRTAPEAIIKLRHIERDARQVRRDKDYEDTQDPNEESQDVFESVPSDVETSPSRRRRDNSTSPTNRIERPLPAVLREFSDSEEEDIEAKALRREAKKAERLKKQQEQQQEVSRRAKRVRHLPLHSSKKRSGDGNDTRGGSSQDMPGDGLSNPRDSLQRRSSTPGSLHSKDDLNPSSDHGPDMLNTDALEPPPSPITSDPEPTITDALNELGPGGKLLKRMYPAFMLPKILGQSSLRKQKHRSRSRSPASVEEGELRPGQSRRRRVHKEATDIRGDTESSEEERSSPSTSPSSPPLSLHPRIEASHGQGIIDLTIDDDGDGEDAISDLSSDALSDGEIAALLTRDHAATRTRFDKGNGIDYMLSRTRFVGGNRRQISRKSTKSASHRKTDPKHLVQTTLTTYGYSHDVPPTSTNNGRTKSQSNRTMAEDHHRRSYDSPSINGPTDIRDEPRSRKENKRKRRHKASQKVYTFANGGSVSINRHRRGHDFITIDYEDEEQQIILANDTIGFRAATIFSPGPHPSLVQTPTSPGRRREKTSSTTRPSDKCRITTTMGIHPITQPVKFGGNTYIGRGYLRELTRLLQDDSQQPARPGSYGAFGLEITPETSSTELIACLSEMWDRILTDITDSLEETDFADPQWQHWHGLMHACCQRVSWIPREVSGEEAINFHEVIQTQSLGFISRLESTLAQSTTPLTHQKLMATWFAIEVCARSGCNLNADIINGIENNPLRRASVCLISQLLSYGLEKTIRLLQGDDDSPVDVVSKTIDQYSLEIWVCLLHTIRSLPANKGGNHPPDNHEHPISSLVIEAMNSRIPVSDSPLRNGESTWLSIFALSKIGQISEHGLLVSDLHLEPLWSLVSRALSSIQLAGKHDEEAVRKFTMRDGLIRILLFRCRRLWTVWKWNFSGSLAVLKQLSEVFRSRRYSGLIGDAAEFPSFIRRNDTSLLTVFEEEDDAFVTFLKLLVRFERGMREDSDFTKLGSNHKKILTLAVPSSALPVTKLTTPTDSTLSMLINRFSALAVATCIDPKKFSHRIEQARGYVQFKPSDHTTQTTCIRGAMYLAALAISIGISAKAAFRWLSEMIDDLLDTYTAGTSSETGNKPPANASAVMIFALGAITKSIELLASHHNARWDAAPFREGWIRKLTKSAYINILGVKSAFSLMVFAFLDAFPETRLNSSFLANEESQGNYESYGFDEDVLQEALGEDAELSSLRASAKRDLMTVAHDYLDQTVFHFMCNEFKRPHTSAHVDRWMAGAEMWIECWTRLANLTVQSGKRSWTAYLDLRNDTWGKIPHEILRRRVELYLLTCILRLDRNAYQPTGRFFVVFLESLTTHHVNTEPTYCSLLLRIDGLKHPLLSGFGDHVYESLSTETFLEHRKEILEAIFFNLSQKLEQYNINQAGDNRKYLADMVKMFQSMTEVHSKLDQEKQHEYATFYNEVMSSAIRHPALRHSPNLQRWIQWGKDHV